MRKHIPHVLTAMVAGLVFAAIAWAQPGIAINKDSTLRGTGSAGSAMGVNTSTLAGSGLSAPTSTTLAVGCGTGLTCSADAVALDRTIADNASTLSEGNNNNFAPTGLGTSPVVLVHAADDSGSVITGIDAIGASIAVGYRFTLCNTNNPQDDGVLALAPEHTSSTAANRIWTPDWGRDTSQTATSRYIIGPSSCTDLIYMQPNPIDSSVKRWVVVDNTRFGHLSLKQLGIYPYSTPAAITGTVNNWDPDDVCAALGGPNGNTCEAGANVASTSYTMIMVTTTDSSGATITGLKYTGAATADGEGPIKIICGGGPGPVTLKNGSASSTTINNMLFGTSGDSEADVVLNGDGRCAILYHPRDASTWFAIAKTDYKFNDAPVYVTKAFTAKASTTLGTTAGTDTHNITGQVTINGPTGGGSGLTIFSASPSPAPAGLSVISNSSSAYTGIRIGRTSTEAIWGVAGGSNHYMNGTVAGDIVLSANGGALFLNSVLNSNAPFEIASEHVLIDGWKFLTKTADQDVTNAGLTNDTELTFSTTANKTYAIAGTLIVSGTDTTGDGLWDVAAAAGTLDCMGTETSLDTALAIQTTAVTATAAADTSDTAIGVVADVTIPQEIRFDLSCKASNTTTVKVRFGNNSASSGRTTRMWTGSQLRYRQVN